MTMKIELRHGWWWNEGWKVRRLRKLKLSQRVSESRTHVDLQYDKTINLFSCKKQDTSKKYFFHFHPRTSNNNSLIRPFLLFFDIWGGRFTADKGKIWNEVSWRMNIERPIDAIYLWLCLQFLAVLLFCCKLCAHGNMKGMYNSKETRRRKCNKIFTTTLRLLGKRESRIQYRCLGWITCNLSRSFRSLIFNTQFFKVERLSVSPPQRRKKKSRDDK